MKGARNLYASPRSYRLALLILIWLLALYGSRAVWAEDPATSLEQIRAENQKMRLLKQMTDSRLHQFFLQGQPSEQNPKPDDPAALEGLLAQLHELKYVLKQRWEREEREPGEDLWNRQGIDVLTAFVEHPWRRSVGESPQSVIHRIKTSPSFQDSFERQEIDELSKMYAQSADETTLPWPYNWREKEEAWLALLETILIAQEANEPGDVFRERLPKDAADALWYRLAYLRLFRHQPKGKFDLELIKPLVEAKKQKVVLGRLCDILTAMPKTSEDQALQQVRTRLEKHLYERLAEIKDDDDLAYYLGSYVHAIPSTLDLLQKWIQTTASVQASSTILMYSHASAEDTKRVLFARQVDVNFNELPLHLAVDRMRLMMHCQIWVDEKVLTDQTPVSLTASGPWLEVLDKVLAASDYRASLIWSKVLWIGRPEDLLETEALASRLPINPGKVREELFARTSLEFVETPLRDVLEYFKDVHNVEIYALEQSDFPITINDSYATLMSALTRMTHAAKLDWLATDQLIVVGTPEQLSRFRRDADQQLRREVLHESQIEAILKKPVSTGIHFDLLPEATDFLAKTSHVKIELLGGKDKYVTLNLKEIPLTTALSLLTITHDLAWDCDGNKIIIGEPKQVAAHMKGVSTP